MRRNRPDATADASAAESADAQAWRTAGLLQASLPSPTTLAVEMRLADAEGGIGCVTTANGAAALHCLLASLLRPQDELLVGASVLGGAIAGLRTRLAEIDVHLRLADPGHPASVRAAMTPATRAILVESISNPGLDVPDFWSLAEIAHTAGIPLLVDNTVTTPACFRPGEFGADLVVYASGTASSGQAAASGGAVVDTGRFDWARGPFPDVAERARKVGELALLARLRERVTSEPGKAPTPWTSFLMLRESETLSAQTRRQSENARYLALMLLSNPAVRAVDYPGLEISAQYPRVQRYFGGLGGSLLALHLQSEENAFRFINALDHIRPGIDADRTHTTVTHPASIVTREQRLTQPEPTPPPDDLVLLGVGCETFSVLAEDIRRALGEPP